MDCQKNVDDDSPFQLNMDTLQSSIFRLNIIAKNRILKVGANIDKILKIQKNTIYNFRGKSDESSLFQAINGRPVIAAEITT